MLENLSQIMSGVKTVSQYECPPGVMSVDVISGPWRYLVAVSFILALGLAWDVQRLMKKNGMEGGFISSALKSILSSFHKEEKKDEAKEEDGTGQPKGPA